MDLFSLDTRVPIAGHYLRVRFYTSHTYLALVSGCDLMLPWDDRQLLNTSPISIQIRYGDGCVPYKTSTVRVGGELGMTIAAGKLANELCMAARFRLLPLFAPEHRSP